MQTKLKFTRTAIDAIPFTQGGNDRKEYRDSEVAGLVLRVSKTSKVYYLFKRDPVVKGKGGETKIKLGNILELTPEDARNRAMKYLTTDGGFRQAQINEETSTVDKLADLFERLHVTKKLKATSQVDYLRQLAKYIRPRWGDRDPRSLTRREIRSAIEERTLESPAQANKLLVVLSSMLTFALKRDAIDFNPCERIEPNVQKRRRRILSREEIVTVLTALNEVEPVKRHYFWLLMLLGQRRTETLLMQWDQFKGKRDVWTIPDYLTKNGLTHSVPLPPLAQAHLAALRIRTGMVPYCFYSWETRHNRKPGPLDPHYVTTFMSRFRKKHMPTSERFTPHDWRRTAATNISEIVRDQAKLKRILNHVDKANVTDVYDLYSYDEVKLECLTRWEARLREYVPQEVIDLSLS